MSDEDGVVTHYAWVDLETTGLDPEVDVPLEMSLILTDTSLKTVHGPATVLITDIAGWWRERLSQNEFVYNMHTENGLIDDLRRGMGVMLIEQADAYMAGILSSYCNPGEVLIAGSTVAGLDLPMIQHWMPETASILHRYRNIDISPMRRFLKFSLSSMPFLITEKQGTIHRAEDDIKNSLQQAVHLKDWLENLNTYKPDIASEEEQ